MDEFSFTLHSLTQVHLWTFRQHMMDYSDIRQFELGLTAYMISIGTRRDDRFSFVRLKSG
jgi:hypothetical protein